MENAGPADAEGAVDIGGVEKPTPPPAHGRTKGFNVETSPLEWYWGQLEKTRGDHVVLAVPYGDDERSEELTLLSQTLGLQIDEVLEFPFRSKPTPSTYVGEGFVNDVGTRLAAHGASAFVIDAPLSPAQVRNLEEALKVPVLDRQGIILSIFEMHARSKLAKMQVELARLKYLQPRLAGMWSGLSRQSGGKGGLGGRGLGETRLELDRRVVKDRVATLTKRLKDAERSHHVQAARRSELPRVALVGYTNAGKSTLMRAMTKSDVLVQDKLFSTLDTTVRPLSPPTEPRILVSDTVGFVKDLPHDLVASFRSTLLEALESRLILHVVDVSHPRWQEHIETTDEVLGEIGAAEIPRLLVLNKIDAVDDRLRMRMSEVSRYLRYTEAYVDRVFVSAIKGEGVPELRTRLIEFFGVKEPAWARP